MLQMGVIRPSFSPWASPILLLRKKDGSIRFAIDYRRVNERLVNDAYPLPHTVDLLDALQGASVFSTLDLEKGYWQVPLEESSKAITAFSTTGGLFEFNVLPFGLSTAPALFQRMMDNCLKGLPFARVYIDDIVVFSNSLKEHSDHLQQVFRRLEATKLTLNVKKCKFFTSEIVFLGTTLTASGIKPNDEKIRAVLGMQKPTDKKKLLEFLGLVNFYRDYCPGLARVSACLYQLLSKSADFVWTTKHY